jgi:hypothetical protein
MHQNPSVVLSDAELKAREDLRQANIDQTDKEFRPNVYEPFINANYLRIALLTRNGVRLRINSPGQHFAADLVVALVRASTSRALITTVRYPAPDPSQPK